MRRYKNLEIQDSFCVFCDLLGFSSEILAQSSITDEENHLKKIYTDFKDASLELLDGMDIWEHKIFSDNIVLGLPVEHLGISDSEAPFGFLLIDLIEYQIKMVLKGHFVRGGWSWGSLYMDDNMIYGKSLIEAHELESGKTKAIYPRIIFSNDMKNLIDKHITMYSSKVHSPQSSQVLKDENNTYFVDYLSFVFDQEFEEEYEIESYIFEHKRIVEEKLTQYSKNTRVLEKYEWVAFYHNEFCKIHISNFKNYSDFLIKNINSRNWQIKKI